MQKHNKYSSDDKDRRLTLAFGSDSGSITKTFLVSLLTISLVPVLGGGCTKNEDEGRIEDDLIYTKTALESPAETSIRCLDIFFFNDDRLQRLDSYQRFEGGTITSATCASRSGPKILVVLANASEDRFTWSEINSLSALSRITVELGNDNPAAPVMSAAVRLKAGADKSVRMVLEPLMAKIVLKAISADFSGRSYSGAKLENVKVYLTNVAGACRMIPDSTDSAPGIILNSGRLSESDLKSLAIPEMLYHELQGPAGTAVRRPGMEFFCYPSEADRPGLGTPPTRLVVEGQIDGKTYYYPVEVNRSALGRTPPGISRNNRYEVSMYITRKGSDNPDTSIEPGTARVILEIEDWTSKPPTVEKY